MKAIIENIRAARYVENIFIVVLIAALGLCMLNGTGQQAKVKSDVELRLERLIGRIDGVGKVDVMVSVDQDDRPVGAAVVTSGVLDVRVRLEIQSAIQALLDIDTQHIRVIGKGGVEE